jgi:hypothetical protein
MKQGPFPHPGLCCPIGSSGTTDPSATLPAGTRLRRTAYTRPSLPGQHAATGAGEGFPSSRTHHATVPIPIPREVLDRCNPGSTRLPWPSPQIPGLGSPSSPEGAKITRRQDSHHATDRPLAHPQGMLDAGLRHQAFPPDAASLLPGLLTATRTGPTPAGECELMFRSGHNQAPPPNAGHTDSG